jgi:very-short-patch-repair endonuclease
MLRDLGFDPVSQVALSDETGLIGRVDFLVDDLVVVEFDGLVKYEGFDGRQALAAEKARESRITATGREVVRVVWSELGDPAALAARIRMAKARAMRRRGLAA